MLGAMILIGLLAGWLFCWASERAAPRPVRLKSPAQGSSLAVSVLPAGLLSGQKYPWLGLHLGVTLVSAAMFGYVWERFGPSWETLRLAATYGFLVVISLIDLKSRRVPNRLVYPAMGLALLFQALASPQALAETAVGGGMALLIFSLTAWLRPGDLGGGDIKLATLIGIGLGFPRVLWALLVGAGVGAVVAVSLIYFWRRDAKSGIPYAPFLCLGAWVALVYNPVPLFLH